MLAHLGHDQLREVHDTHASAGLGQAERVASLVIVELSGNPDGKGVKVDVFRAERGEFRPAETGEGR
jgi:hypothetical protein